MAPVKRRSARADKGQPPVESPKVPPAEEPSDEEQCPSCNPSSQLGEGQVESWIRCQTCKDWYHWRCAGDGSDIDTIDVWHCQRCSEGNPKRNITRKPPARKSSRKRTHLDYAKADEGLQTDPTRFMRMMEGKNIKDAEFKHMLGADVGESWLEEDESAMTEPVIIDSTDGLGITMPPPDFGVEDVAELLESDMPVEVIDVASQSNSPGWTIASWADYYALESRDKVLNVISLEITGTPIANLVLPPRIFRELDWVEKFWPNTRKGKGQAYPKVQLYCLMGVAGAWTDWHIDFAGSSVYYHIHTGSKVFYFIRPTPANLAAYERWSGTDLQNHQWLGDMCDEVYKVTLTQGNTMIIPTGWIHAVYTPVDTLVFGGNFLHTYNMSTQLRVREIEIATQVPKKFRFPQFSKLCWYAGDKYMRDIKNKEEFSPRLLEGIEALAEFLVSEARLIEQTTTPEATKKDAKDQVPTERVKDAGAMSRELRWRVKAVAGRGSDVENTTEANGLLAATKTVNGNKRKRGDADSAGGSSSVRFKNFRPKLWDQIKEEEPETGVRETVKGRNADSWAEWKDAANEDGAEPVEMKTRRDVIVKVRKTETGVERQRVERVVEIWDWAKPPTVEPDVKADKMEEVPAAVEPIANVDDMQSTDPEPVEANKAESPVPADVTMDEAPLPDPLSESTSQLDEPPAVTEDASVPVPSLKLVPEIVTLVASDMQVDPTSMKEPSNKILPLPLPLDGPVDLPDEPPKDSQVVSSPASASTPTPALPLPTDEVMADGTLTPPSESTQ